MKKIYLFLIGALFLILPSPVFASNAKIGIAASDTVMVGNNVTVTVTLSSTSLIGSWEADLSYDKDYLQLTKSTAEGGGTYMVNVAQNGTKSQKYTFTFKALKSGSARVSINSYSLYDYNTMEQMSATGASKSISIKTKEQIEASYSSNAYLKSISVDGYTLTPNFNKEVMEYSIEVPNEVENVTLSAAKEDGASSVSGTGDKSLVEGNNKFEIVVTAQKGNSLKYTVNVYRKELNPISISIGGSEYTIVRKSENLPEYKTFSIKNITYEEEEIPALYSEITDTTLIGLKDDAGNITTYVYENNKITNIYFEIDNYAYSLVPLALKEDSNFASFKKEKIEINGVSIDAYIFPNNNKYAVIYAQNVENGKDNYYSYFKEDGSFQVYNAAISESYEEKLTTYKYVFMGLTGFIVLLLLIIIIRKPSKKKHKKQEELVKKIEEHIDSEINKEIDHVSAVSEISDNSEIRLVKSEKKKKSKKNDF